MKLFPLLVPAGSDSQVQYNNGGIFGADSTFTFNDTTKVLDVDGLTITGTIATGLDMSGGTFATSIQKWPAGTIQTTGTTIFQPAVDSATAYQFKNAAGTSVPLDVDTSNTRIGIGTNAPEGTLHIKTSDVVGGAFNAIADDLCIEVNGSGGITILTPNDAVGAIYFADPQALGGYYRYDHATDRYDLGIGNNIFRVSATAFAFNSNREDVDFAIHGDTNFSQFYFNAGTERFGFGGEINAESLIELTHSDPYFTFHNSTHEDTDGGRESRLNFKGEQSGGEETTLARIEVGHDGAADDEKGYVDIYVNDGNDGNTPTKRLRIDSMGAIFYYNVKSGADQAAAGAAAGEIWKTNGHLTLPDNVLMIGI